MSFDSRQFRQILGRFTTGVTVITAHDRQGSGVGVTINSLTSVSLEPPLILFCLEKKARSLRVFKSSDSFAVNILAADQEDLSRHFATPNQPPLDKKRWAAPVDGCPLLRGTLGWMLCRKTAVHPGGDHLIFVAEVIRLHQPKGNQKPLIYYRSGYHQLAPLPTTGAITGVARRGR